MDEHIWEERRKGIGGSDVAAILGISPWKSDYQVYLEKIGEAGPKKQNDAMSYGLLVEPVIRQWYTNETANVFIIPHGPIASKKYPWMRATLDGVTRAPRVIEIKTARSSQDWGEPGTDEIPDYYAAQVHHYMVVTEIPVCDVVVSFAGSMPVIYSVEWDQEIADMLIEREADFWRRVEERDPPEATTYADVVRRWSKAQKGVEATATSEIEMVLASLKTTRSSINTLSETEEQLKTRLMKFLGDAEVLVGLDGKPLVTWKNSKPVTRFDAKALQQELPEVYEKFLVTGEETRRFLIK